MMSPEGLPFSDSFQVSNDDLDIFEWVTKKLLNKFQKEIWKMVVFGKSENGFGGRSL